MKILIIGDLHIRESVPYCRKDDSDTILRKLEWIGKQTWDTDLIITTGDVFNTSTVGYDLFLRTLSVVKKIDCPIYFVYGNHDLQYHSMKRAKHSSLSALRILGGMKGLSDAPRVIDSGEVLLFGCSYGETPKEYNREHLPSSYKSIMVTHNELYPDPPHWAEDALSYKQYAARFSYDIYIVGHIHDPATIWVEDKLFINPGRVYREAINLADYKPKVVMLDTETMTTRDIFIPIEDVFVEQQSKATIDMEAMMDAIRSTGDTVSFSDKLERVLVSGKVKQEVAACVREHRKD